MDGSKMVSCFASSSSPFNSAPSSHQKRMTVPSDSSFSPDLSSSLATSSDVLLQSGIPSLHELLGKELSVALKGLSSSQKSWLVFTKTDLLDKNSPVLKMKSFLEKKIRQKRVDKPFSSTAEAELQHKDFLAEEVSSAKNNSSKKPDQPLFFEDLSLKEKFSNQFLKLLETLNLQEVFFVSSVTKAGLSHLKEKLLSYGHRNQEDFLITNSRHYEALKKMRDSLLKCLKKEKRKKEDTQKEGRASRQKKEEATKQKEQREKEIEKQSLSLDIMALNLQEGLTALYEILGKQVDDKVLDQVFEKFCIGK